MSEGFQQGIEIVEKMRPYLLEQLQRYGEGYSNREQLAKEIEYVELCSRLQTDPEWWGWAAFVTGSLGWGLLAESVPHKTETVMAIAMFAVATYCLRRRRAAFADKVTNLKAHSLLKWIEWG